MSWGRQTLHKRKRVVFFLEMMRNAMKPYEIGDELEENLIGEFENEVEKDFFNIFFDQVKEPKLILDLACGDGRHTAKLCDKAKFVVGLDLSNNNIAKASRKLCNNENAGLVHASMFNPPFASERFDGIWFSQAFEYVPPDCRESFVAQLFSLSKPEGVVYMSVETWQYPSLLATIKEFLGDVSLFLYWKVVKRKPLIWGEYLYYLPPTVQYKGWHYHVHTSRRTIGRILKKVGFEVVQSALFNGYIYMVCRKIRRRDT